MFHCRLEPNPTESVASYLRRMSIKNGLPSLRDLFRRMKWEKHTSPDECSLKQISNSLDINLSELLKLGMYYNGKQSSPGFMFGNIEIAKHQIVKHQRVCVECMVESKIIKANWNIGWLPYCAKHGRVLVELEETEIFRYLMPRSTCINSVHLGDSVSNRHRKNQEYLDAVFEQNKLMNSEAIQLPQRVDREIEKSLNLNCISELKLRKRRYPIKNYPFKKDKSHQFFECLSEQLVA